MAKRVTDDEVKRAIGVAQSLLQQLHKAMGADASAGMFVVGMAIRMMHAVASEEARDEIERWLRDILVETYEQRERIRNQKAQLQSDGTILVQIDVRNEPR